MRRVRPVGVWRYRSGHARVLFLRERDGRITYLFFAAVAALVKAKYGSLF
jgi:hypothetical protein